MVKARKNIEENITGSMKTGRKETGRKRRGAGRRLLSLILVLSLCLSQSLTVFAEEPEGTEEKSRYSEEYKTTEYYTRLQQALTETADASVMARTLAVAQSQEGYKDYPMSSTTADEARQAGMLWTGKAWDSSAQDSSGNTEYTRWAQEYVMERAPETYYLDCDWCAIFASWCMYQAGYYSDSQLKKYFYSYYADPREEKLASTWIEAFNFENDKVWYTPAAARKVAAYSWGQYTHTDVDPYEIPYQPGGLIFFSWDASGNYFSHVGIVVSYDSEEHILTYINGNTAYAVTTREMDLDADEEFYGQVKTQNSNRIMAYAEYEKYTDPEPKTLTADQTEFQWTRGSEDSIEIQTDSLSKTVRLTADCGFWDSNQTWPSQLILRYGKVTIGTDLLDYLPDGENVVTLDFADGQLTLRINITTPMIETKTTTFVWKRSSETGLKIETSSGSDSVIAYGDGFVGRGKTTDATIKDGVVTLSRNFLQNMKDGENQVTLIFGDGNLVLHVNVYVTGWQQEGSYWYYYDENGEKMTGLLTIDDRVYYLDASGRRTTGWQFVNSKWYYMDSSGKACIGWKNVGKKIYYFEKNGVRKTGWLTLNNKKYLLDAEGALVTGWYSIKDKTYYFKASGVMVTGWTKINDKYYYFNKSGVKKTGMISLNGKKYYLNAKGVRTTGFQTINGKKYYFNASGVMVKGCWKKISGKTYYFNNNGTMAVSEWIQGRKLDRYGVWSYKPKGKWHKNSKGKWYGDSSGWHAKDVTLRIDGKTYTFKSNGYVK